MATILIVDDNVPFCGLLEKFLSGLGHGVVKAHTLGDGMKVMKDRCFDVVLLDVDMPDGNGIEYLPRFMSNECAPEDIIITGKGEPEGAELAIRYGAWDYIQKGGSLNELSLPIVRALQYRKEKLLSASSLDIRREKIIGKSPAVRSCLDQIAQAASGDASVIITGETGTGKELFAWAIHNNSARSQKNFVVVDCTALPDTLVESILFGHVKGAFTGAHYDHTGLVKQADGGTLFLDEVGELPMSAQKTFLRVLEEKRFRPIGSQKLVDSDFRLVAATNRDLDAMVRKEKFRSDLLFRLQSFRIELPPLRQRIEDIEDIVRYHTMKVCDQYGIDVKEFSPEFFSVLASYSWPGNVRELVNTIERAISCARFERTLFPRHLPTAVRIQVARSSVNPGVPAETERRGLPRFEQFPRYRDYKNLAEKQYVIDLLAFTGGNKSEACRVSGLSRANLYNLINKHDISS